MRSGFPAAIFSYGNCTVLISSGAGAPFRAGLTQTRGVLKPNQSAPMTGTTPSAIAVSISPPPTATTLLGFFLMVVRPNRCVMVTGNADGSPALPGAAAGAGSSSFREPQPPPSP